MGVFHFLGMFCSGNSESVLTVLVLPIHVLSSKSSKRCLTIKIKNKNKAHSD